MKNALTTEVSHAAKVFFTTERIAQP